MLPLIKVSAPPLLATSSKGKSSGSGKSSPRRRFDRRGG
jgi:hypothetical protein